MATLKNTQLTGEILHCGAIRYQITGSGNFESTLISLGDVISADLSDIPMTAATAREPTILSNFNQQRFYLKGKTTVINEKFLISRIIIYIRPVASGYPT